MRLIHVETLHMQEFFDSNLPKYACLSHRWSGQEVTFQYWNQCTDDIEAKTGYQKILAACNVVRELQSLEWIWVDTCCIDKTNSTELSEAINSMWRWYRDCSICVAYLQDVDQYYSSGSTLNDDTKLGGFADSEWFRRAWTLQELIAPARVTFYNGNWEYLGEKESLCQDLERITGIDAQSLLHYSHNQACIARKMSWASGRQATRSEDVAYSLLGLFDVNMPLLYGQGTKAFTRLQEEIMRRSTDLSILAWKANEGDGTKPCAFLASSPQQFQHCKTASQHSSSDELTLSESAGFVLNNVGLHMQLRIAPWKMNLFVSEVAQSKSGSLYLLLERIGKDVAKRHMQQPFLIKNAESSDWFELMTISMLRFSPRRITLTSQRVRHHLAISNSLGVSVSAKLKNRTLQGSSCVWPNKVNVSSTWNKQREGIEIELGGGHDSHGTIAVHLAKTFDGRAVEVVLLGFDKDYNPMCMIYKEDVIHYSKLSKDAESHCPHLFDSRWTDASWDSENGTTHVYANHKWIDLGRGAYIFKSIDQQPFVTGSQAEARVRFSLVERAWWVDIWHSLDADPPNTITTLKSIVQCYRLRTFGPDYGDARLESVPSRNGHAEPKQALPVIVKDTRKNGVSESFLRSSVRNEPATLLLHLD